MKYLLNVVETYRVDTEQEANQLIEEAKADGNLIKYSCNHKERKQKGELVDEWYAVVLSRKFTDEKEPEGDVRISYEN